MSGNCLIFVIRYLKRAMGQSYRTGAAKVIKPAQPLGKDRAKMNHSTAGMLLLSLFTTFCIIGVHLLFAQFGDIGLMKFFSFFKDFFYFM